MLEYIFLLEENFFVTTSRRSHPGCFYCGHQRSWNLTSSNNMQVSKLQSYDHNRNLTKLRVNVPILLWKMHMLHANGHTIQTQYHTITPHDTTTQHHHTTIKLRQKRTSKSHIYQKKKGSERFWKYWQTGYDVDRYVRWK